jgi:3-isopropylmalate dehydrogenase
MKPSKSFFNVAVIRGDGIGPEVMNVCMNVLQAVMKGIPELRLEFVELSSGAGKYRDTGVDISPEDWTSIQAADAILLGATGLPDVRYANGTEVDTPITIRERLGLTASIRPAQSLPGVPAVLSGKNGQNIDFIVVRETTEGLFAGRNEGKMEGDERASNVMAITRAASERLFDLTFELAKNRKAKGYAGRVTLVDKANVISCLAFLRKIFYEKAAQYPDIEATHLHVDAASLLMIRDPHRFDVIVTENQYGDILSEIGAAIVGGLGIAPSGDVNSDHAVFQPSHGSAPDITGQGIANPVAAILSAVMMLEWLGERYAADPCLRAARVMRESVNEVLGQGVLTPDLGGTASTQDVGMKVTEAVSKRLSS